MDGNLDRPVRQGAGRQTSSGGNAAADGNAAVAELGLIASQFSSDTARRKLQLIERIADNPPTSLASWRHLNDLTCFLRTYPDSPRIRNAAELMAGALRRWSEEGRFDPGSASLLGQGLPGTTLSTEYCFPLLHHMFTRRSSSFEIDWEDFDDQEPLLYALGLLVTAVECQGLDDVSLTLTDWFRMCRSETHTSDLQFLLELFSKGGLPPAVRDVLFERAHIPIRYELCEPGTARCELAWPVDRMHYQKKELSRTRPSVKAVVRRPFRKVQRLPSAQGDAFIDLAQRTLCSRDLEIRTLSYANREDVTLLECGRGIQIALVGVVPDYRDPLECHYCCLVLKNGIPMAYGPGTVSLGCCEIGLNLFPEYRGAEVRYIYPQLMRALHQVLGAQYFFLTSYGMGEGNAAAIRTGAFWFYRRLGFLPTNPKVEDLAREEEERMKREPGVRSNSAMLRRLSHTSAYLDLSSGTRRPLPLAEIGQRQSRFIAREFAGDRRLAEERSIARVSRILGQNGVSKLSPAQQRAFALLAPILAEVPELERWSAVDRRRMLAVLVAKGASCEHEVDRLICGHETFVQALYRSDQQAGNATACRI